MSSDVARFPTSITLPADERTSADKTTRTRTGLVPQEREARTAKFSSIPTGDIAESEDEDLLHQVASGDKEALSHLFRRHARTVRNVAYRILHNAAEADDLVQDVFLFVFKKAHLFDPVRGSARSWLVQVTYHRAIDRRRYLTSRGFHSHCELDEALLELADLQARYDDSIEAVLGREALDRIEASLSELQRRVLHLRFVDGCAIDEIAAILGQSAGNIRNHYYRALERIRRELFGKEQR